MKMYAFEMLYIDMHYAVTPGCQVRVGSATPQVAAPAAHMSRLRLLFRTLLSE